MQVDHIILDRSLDAILAAAALLSTVEIPERVRFTFLAHDAFEPVTFTGWPAQAHVFFVGPLAGTVNAHPRLVALLRTLKQAGHVVAGILDTHYEVWRKAMIEAAELPEKSDPLIGHGLPVFPQRSWTSSSGLPFEVSAAEPFMNQRRHEMNEGTLALCKAAVSFLRKDPGTHRTRAVFEAQIAKGDWASAHLIRALGQKPLAVEREWEVTTFYASFLRTEANHVAILADSNQSGDVIYAGVGGLEINLSELRAQLLGPARFAVIRLSAGEHHVVHIATRMRVDLLAVAKQVRIAAKGVPHGIDVAPGEAEGILAVAVPLSLNEECAS